MAARNSSQRSCEYGAVEQRCNSHRHPCSRARNDKQESRAALTRLHDALKQKAAAFDHIVKIGRTHLNDATPIRLGQEFSGYTRQIELAIERIRDASKGLQELALGGTAVGTGINTHREFAARAIKVIAAETGLPFREAENYLKRRRPETPQFM